MTTLSKTDQTLREVFKRFNLFMLSMWRLGLGGMINGWPEVGGRIMVITHTGRKSRLRRRTPVNYALVDGEIYCTAGFGSVADWYRNMMVDPQVEVWLPDGWWAGVAEDVSDHPDRLRLMREVLIASGFAARIFGMDPKRMSDEDLDAATKEYCLVRIRRTAPCTGTDGPGDLAWVWPVATLVLLVKIMKRKR